MNANKQAAKEAVKKGLVLITWTCRCCGHIYSDPRNCLHTDISNLICSDKAFSDSRKFALFAGTDKKLCT